MRLDSNDPTTCDRISTAGMEEGVNYCSCTGKVRIAFKYSLQFHTTNISKCGLNNRCIPNVSLILNFTVQLHNVHHNATVPVLKCVHRCTLWCTVILGSGYGRPRFGGKMTKIKNWMQWLHVCCCHVEVSAERCFKSVISKRGNQKIMGFLIYDVMIISVFVLVNFFGTRKIGFGPQNSGFKSTTMA